MSTREKLIREAVDEQRAPDTQMGQSLSHSGIRKKTLLISRFQSFAMHSLSQDTLLFLPPGNSRNDLLISQHQVIYYCHESISRYGTKYFEMVVDHPSLRNSTLVQHTVQCSLFKWKNGHFYLSGYVAAQPPDFVSQFRCISNIVLGIGIAIYHLNFQLV